MKRTTHWAAAPLVILALPTLASAQAGEERYAGAGGWRVLEQGVSCAMFSASVDGQPRLVVAGFRRAGTALEITLAEQIPDSRRGNTFELRIGSLVDRLGLDRRGRMLAMLGLSPAIENAIKRGDTLEVLENGETIAAVPLTGSAAAFRALEDCIATLPSGPILPPPAPELPRIPIAAPDLSGPLPPDRALSPIMAQHWIEERDFLYADGNFVGGRVSVRLGVGPDGQVKRCEVTGSSGNEALDSHTCDRLAARARFNPATDADGQTVASSYTTTIAWQMAD